MMGHQSRSEALFYYFRLEDQVPENHLLRLIDRHVNFEFIRAKLKDSYSDAGRPSIDPELLLRLLLVGYLYGVTSERKLVEELRMHLAWRWFTGLGFDQEIPHHSTFSKNRHGRFQESKLFEQLFSANERSCLSRPPSPGSCALPSPGLILHHTADYLPELTMYRALGHHVFAMKKELSPKQALAVRCPTCGAAPGEKCELTTGRPRTDSHRDRRLIAKE